LSQNSEINKRALIVGASSGVGRALASVLAERGFSVTVAAREHRDLSAVANHVSATYGQHAKTLILDLESEFKIDCTLFDSVFITAGVSLAQDDLDQIPTEDLQRHLLNKLTLINYTGPAQILLQAASTFLGRTTPTYIGVCSTIAAPLPRSRNLLYAAAKNALESLVRSLQHKAFDSNLKIQIFRLGYVDSALSYGQKLLFPAKSPEFIAKAMFDASQSSCKRVIYLPGYWRYIVLILKSLPWMIFGRMRF
jgi:decaprenylphospho-beta-D-erythro-pentofuranosid-2-ulose 2-reductase